MKLETPPRQREQVLANSGRMPTGNDDIVTDAELLNRIASADARAFDAFVDRYKRRLAGYIRVRVGDRHAAEDLTQEVFLRLFRSTIGAGAGRSAGFAGRSSVATWLFTIAQNCIADHRR